MKPNKPLQRDGLNRPLLRGRVRPTSIYCLTMDPYLEISVSLASKAVTFFIGTGFSKYITDGKAPSWIDLLVELTARIDTRRKTILKKLFNTDESENISPKIELSICAQVLELEYRKKNLDIRTAVADILRENINDATVNDKKVKLVRRFFKAHPHVNIVTTNYDSILSEYILKGHSKVFVDGSPIPKSNIGQNVFHIHGCITKPSSMVLTINDYFRFQHKDNYLSRKFYTLLQENTVVILGYSLGDFNLNRIFNEAQVNRAVSLRKSDIFLINRDSVDDVFSSFYSFSYGIHVIELTEIDEFLSNIGDKNDEAQELINETESLTSVMQGSYEYKDDYIKLGTSFNNILLQAYAINIDPEDPKLINVLINVLKKKRDFTGESGAWNQYSHFAEWLIDFGTLVNVQKNELSKEYLGLVGHSFRTMSQEQRWGYSWAAYRIWKSRFQEIKFENQKQIKKYIRDTFHNGDDPYNLI